MAKTGINIQVKDTALGAPINVNATTLLFVEVPEDTLDLETVTVEAGEPFDLYSLSDLEAYGLTEDNATQLYNHVRDFYNPCEGINNTGTLLWVNIGVNKLSVILKSVVDSGGFDKRPRNVLYAQTYSQAEITAQSPPIESTIDIGGAQSEGFYTVVVAGIKGGENPQGPVSGWVDLATLKSPFVGYVVSTNGIDADPCVGKVGGILAATSVGTSIGDCTLPPASDKSEILFNQGSIDVSVLDNSRLNEVAEKQYIFLRPRAPKNGLWFNDGATANDASNALSTLEASRTLCAIVDDLRAFFTTYINTRVPVTASGDIQPAYKQTVLDNAFDRVIQPYIDSGDISDARISLVAQNNDMVGTRTWEVSLSILPAPTLRWVEGFVFYVNKL